MRSRVVRSAASKFSRLARDSFSRGRPAARLAGPLGALALLSGCGESLLAREHNAQASLVGVSQYAAGSEPTLTELPDVPSVVGQRLTFVRIRIALRAHGTWGEHPALGPVWYPSSQSAGAAFVPYLTAGRWVPTDAGMYWASDLPFGWVTFHYGRWIQHEGRWAWVPGAQFAPAWVDWRYSNAYAGWAPLPPVGMPVSAPYAFCPYGSLTAVGVYRTAIVGAAAVSLYPTTTAAPVRRGFGGAAYAWGPAATGVGPVFASPATPAGGSIVATPASPSANPTGPQVVVGASAVPAAPITLASAWSGETGSNPRSGAPVGEGAREDNGARDALRAEGQGAREAYERGSGDDLATARSPRVLSGEPAEARVDRDRGAGDDGVGDARDFAAPPRGFRDYEPVRRYRITETVRIDEPSEPIYDAPSGGFGASAGGGSSGGYAGPAAFNPPAGSAPVRASNPFAPPRITRFEGPTPMTFRPPAPPDAWSPPAAPWSPPSAPPAWAANGGGAGVNAPSPSYAPPSFAGPARYAAPAPVASQVVAPPTFAAPAPSFAAPTFAAPAPSFAAPTFAAPAQLAPATLRPQAITAPLAAPTFAAPGPLRIP